MNTLYKYMPFRQEFFDNFLVRCSQRAALNDPFEILPGLNYLIECEFGITSQPSGRWGETREEMRANLSGDLSDHVRQLISFTDELRNVGIISLTETRDNLLMWSHYGDNHRGLVIEYNINHPFFTSLDGHTERLDRVRYRKRRTEGLVPDRQNPGMVDLYAPLFEKSDEWIYEKEHRVIRKFVNSDHIFVNKEFWDEHASHTLDTPPPTTHGGKKYELTGPAKPLATVLLNSSELLCFFRIPVDAIVSVTCGALMSKDSVNIVKAKAKEHGFVCQKATIDDDDYCLQFETLTSTEKQD